MATGPWKKRKNKKKLIINTDSILGSEKILSTAIFDEREKDTRKKEKKRIEKFYNRLKSIDKKYRAIIVLFFIFIFYSVNIQIVFVIILLSSLF